MDNREQALTNEISEDIVESMLSLSDLTPNQIKDLKRSLKTTLAKYKFQQDKDSAKIAEAQQENAMILRDFINAKRIEGRSNTTCYNYAKEVSKLFLALNKSYRHITSSDIRDYMAWRKSTRNLSSVSVANMRMYLKSFFKWCYVEELIPKDPMDKIGVIKTEQRVVEVLTDEEQEIIRCACTSERDMAIVDLLSGSGMRVSELCGLNIKDVDFDKGEVLVFGKGSKERICFLTGKAKVHLKWYLKQRTDENPALFVTSKRPYSRLTPAGVEFILKQIAKNSGMPEIRLYPHKYRATLATNMINKGAQAESVQGILGHANVDTTLKCYCKVDKESYKRAHQQFS